MKFLFGLMVGCIGSLTWGCNGVTGADDERPLDGGGAGETNTDVYTLAFKELSKNEIAASSAQLSCFDFELTLTDSLGMPVSEASLLLTITGASVTKDLGVLAEEGSTRDSDSGIVWVVDPIDGTTNFLYNLAGFAVSIAATVDGRSIAGAVYLPATRELFVAARGAGAWLGGRRLRCSPTTEASQALIGTGFSYLAEERARQGRRVASLIEHVRDVRRLGAAAPDLCFVADGRLDAYFEENLRPWDVAAGSLVAEEAGAIVTDFTGGPASDGQILASTPGIHGAMSELLTGPLHST
jgi:fructose-1,6-bisphosphatase/inositol monophosphatase family enzyme